ncbi:E3 ubiquitin-protein ligase UPL5-like [Solanum tuberosum]|uniref:E3 ubiquitin-protein ligase UPL5-like n=1 Tax=Solanum tuberosum TaxID=4113 RepID=UPI00073A2282|nr:PREDICTED: E3 ubiquitin-protein ligase UPL5-like [Solanum tuberosum]
MAYQLPHETSTKRKFNDYAAASTARMRHNEILFNSSLKTPIQFFVRMFSGGKTLVIQAYSSDTVTSLELSQTLSECGVQNDDTLQLMSDLNLVIHDLCNCNDDTDINANVTRMTKMLTDFLANTPKDGADGSEEYLQIFIYFSVPAAMVKLYVSPSVIKKQAAHGCICQFIDNCKILFTDPTTVYRQFAPIFFEFCTILRGAAGVDDTLYIFCRSSLAAMMKRNVHDVKHVLRLQDIFPFVHELATRLSHALELSVQLAEFIQLSESDVREFIQFMHRVKCAIRRQKAFGSLVSFPSLMQDEAGNERSEIKGVHHVFCDLLEKSELCLKELERQLGLMLLEGRHKNEELYEMLICRSRLFEDSFEYIGHASPRSLRGQLFIQFENEEATGPGVLREWFSLVCEAIFNPQNALFVSCPNDGRRFFPNPALHLEYFVFSGRIIALALLYRVQISIAFDRVFFLQLAGEDISFEDIRDADPYLYSGCKKILKIY